MIRLSFAFVFLFASLTFVPGCGSSDESTIVGGHDMASIEAEENEESSEDPGEDAGSASSGPTADNP